jgi:acetylornithine/succinyldiaminopimelate/putrescine aminotransferase
VLGQHLVAAMIDAILRDGFEEFREFVNPLIALRAEITGEPARAVRARDGQLVDAAGQLIEDFNGAQAFGHRHPHVTRMVQAFLESDSASWFPSRVNPYAGSLARRLCVRTGYTNAFFASSGSEAVESSMKLARAATGKVRVLSLDHAYHGCTMGSVSLMMDGPLREPFAPHLPGSGHLPPGDVRALEAALRPGDVAGIVVEPIQLEGGVRALTPDYIEALCELTTKHGALLIADEVQTGLGRTGQFLASESWPRRPDAVLLAKHLGGGLLPISAMLTRRDLHDRAYGKTFESSEAHNCTFSGSAVVAIASHAALDLLTDELVAHVAKVGAAFRESLREALQHLPLFADVRGAGFIVGIELRPIDHPWLSFQHFGMADLDHHPTTGLLLCHRLYKRGYFCFVCGHDWSVVRLQPRFTIEVEKLTTFVAAVREELAALGELA